MNFIKIVITISFVECVMSVITTVNPTWITSNFVQADSRRVIDGDACACKTGNSSTPTATMPFATAFPSIPNLGYGMSNYQGINI